MLGAHNRQGSWRGGEAHLFAALWLVFRVSPMTFLGLSPGQNLAGQLALALASVHLGAFQRPKG